MDTDEFLRFHSTHDVLWQMPGAIHLNPTLEQWKLRYRLTGRGSPGIDGVTQLATWEEQPYFQNCMDYVFDKKPLTVAMEGRWSMGMLIEHGTITINPEKGDYAVYFDSDGNFRHIGVRQDDGTIISKWGNMGGLYRHRPNLVPLSRGDTLIYFKRMPSLHGYPPEKAPVQGLG